MQLGGPRVMGENGVSHYVVNDDLEGVKVVLRWLSYCPPQLGAEPPLLPTSDPVDRPVAYEPAEHEKLDPRAAISGGWGGFLTCSEQQGPVYGHITCDAAACAAGLCG
jgi:acetyl-CoA carboxylase/biotin carboxylase 1